MNIEMALKSRSYIFDLDHVKLSLEIFFFLSSLIESIFHQLSRSTFIFVKNTHQKAANLTFCLISPVAKSPVWSLEGQFNKFPILVIPQIFSPGIPSDCLSFLPRRLRRSAQDSAPSTKPAYSTSDTQHNNTI